MASQSGIGIAEIIVELRKQGMPVRNEVLGEAPPSNVGSPDQAPERINQAAAEIALSLTPAVERVLAELQRSTQAESEKIVRDYEARLETLDKQILPLINALDRAFQELRLQANRSSALEERCDVLSAEVTALRESNEEQVRRLADLSNAAAHNSQAMNDLLQQFQTKLEAQQDDAMAMRQLIGQFRESIDGLSRQLHLQRQHSEAIEQQEAHRAEILSDALNRIARTHDSPAQSPSAP